VVSAFLIGWRDLNVGSWIARMQPREYALRAKGWVRVVSGVQFPHQRLSHRHVGVDVLRQAV
jgi:hypothetical protein